MNNRTFQRSLRVKGAYYYRNDEGMKDLEHYFKWHSSDKYVELQPEPTNRHDPNAIRVLCGGSLIGFIPKDETASVHQLIKKFGLQNVKAVIARNKANFSDYMIYASVFVEGANPELEDEDEDEEYVPKSKPVDKAAEITAKMMKLKVIIHDLDKPLMTRSRARTEFTKLQVELAMLKNESPKNLCQEILDPNPTKSRPHTLADLKAKMQAKTQPTVVDPITFAPIDGKMLVSGTVSAHKLDKPAPRVMDFLDLGNTPAPKKPSKVVDDFL